MRAFTLVLAGQVVSLLGSSLTQFALTVWAYQVTGSATALALTAFFGFAPGIIFSPIAGALVDRWDRRLVMMFSDLGGGLATVALFLLYSSGNLQIWHLYVAGAIAGTAASFQWPAYSAAISVMIPKEQYARANGMISLAESLSNVVAPALAVALLAIIGIAGVMLIDIVTFIVAISAVLAVRIPNPEVSAAGQEGKGSLLQEAVYGFRYIVRIPSLLGLQLLFFGINFMGTFGAVLTAPFLLARNNGDETVLATAQSIGAIGGILGGLLLTTWGGPKRRVNGVLLGMVGTSLLGEVLMGVGRSVIAWGAALFFLHFFMPILNGSNQAIWQAKVQPDVQGRVFAARRMIAQISAPVAMILAGPLADQVFEPAMREGGALAPVFGWLVGTGAGAGMGLIFVIFGIAGVLVALSGYLFQPIREAETLLPDHTAAQAKV
ncbi:MAG: MFS transporter [Anaerolinea sp.]|nr:MFS transporter [Anaerolinea sp.]